MKSIIMGVHRSLSGIAAAGLPCLVLTAQLFAQTDTLPPNILITLDNSGSMGTQAYAHYSWQPNTSLPLGDTLWMPASGHPDYYGYFNNDSSYNYASSRFTAAAGGTWPGWLLNWAVMSRTDVLRKVLVGGKYTVNQLYAGCNTDWYKYYIGSSPANYNRLYAAASGGNTVLTVTRTGLNPPINATLANAVVTVVAPPPFRGVINELYDKDGDGAWDGGAARLGLWLFNDAEGGHISMYINDPTLSDCINAIQYTSPQTWTPHAESFFEMLHYFGQTNRHYFNADFTTQLGGRHDPYYDTATAAMAPCTESFVLLLTDAEPTKDGNVPGYPGSAQCAHLPDAYNVGLRYNGPDEPNPPGTWPDSGTGMLDDVALYGHNTDLRPDLPGVQNVQLCCVNCFGAGSELFGSAAKAGSFTDLNGDSLPGPDTMEWDGNGDGVPDFYFQGENGWQLDTAITAAFQAITARAISAPTLADPVLLSPPDGGIIGDPTPELCWSQLAGATQYKVQVATDTLFDLCEVNYTTPAADTTYRCDSLPDGWHYWRVKSFAACDYSAWSPAWSFRIETPLAVQLSLLEACGRPGGGIAVRWRTECEQGCYQWQVERSTSAAGGFRTVATMPGGGSCNQPRTYEYIDGDIDWSVGEYYYRLAEKDMDGAVTHHGPVRGIPMRPSTFALHNARPNPARTSAAIAYQTAKPGHVTLDVYDIAGRRIDHVDEGMRQPGYYSMDWNVKGQPAGVYFYRLKAGDWQAVRKLMIVR